MGFLFIKSVSQKNGKGNGRKKREVQGKKGGKVNEPLRRVSIRLVPPERPSSSLALSPSPTTLVNSPRETRRNRMQLWRVGRGVRGRWRGALDCLALERQWMCRLR